MHGVMDRPDTKRMGTRKKVKSMEANQVDEISKGMAGRYLKKVPSSAADAGRKSAGTTGIWSGRSKEKCRKRNQKICQ